MSERCSARCRVADPSVSAKVFTTFNCEQFDGEFDGSDSWMRVDLSIDCNAPERSGWIAYAVVMILLYPATTADRTHHLPTAHTLQSAAQLIKALGFCT